MTEAEWRGCDPTGFGKMLLFLCANSARMKVFCKKEDFDVGASWHEKAIAQVKSDFSPG